MSVLRFMMHLYVCEALWLGQPSSFIKQNQDLDISTRLVILAPHNNVLCVGILWYLPASLPLSGRHSSTLQRGQLVSGMTFHTPASCLQQTLFHYQRDAQCPFCLFREPFNRQLPLKCCLNIQLYVIRTFEWLWIMFVWCHTCPVCWRPSKIGRASCRERV